jgi:hypothetical protein
MVTVPTGHGKSSDALRLVKPEPSFTLNEITTICNPALPYGKTDAFLVNKPKSQLVGE